VLAVVLAGCGGGGGGADAPDQRATLVVDVNVRGERSVETFVVVDGQLEPGKLDGPRVYGHAGEGDEQGITYEEIYLRGPDGTVRQLTSDGRADLAPRLLRDGRVAFVSCALTEGAGPPGCRLDAINPRTDERKTLLDDLGIVFHGELSPDETRFLYTRIHESGKPAGLFVRELPGGEERRLLDGHGGRWSPEGDRIAFLSDRDENGRCLFHDCTGHAAELYVADADGSNERRLTQNAEDDGAHAWSGDGEWLVLGRIPDEDADWDLYAVRADGACERQLTDTPRWETPAEWRGGGHGGLAC